MTYEEFVEKYNITLNRQQEEAVLENGHSVALIAVPGSGKTTTMIIKIGYMIHCLDIAPENILAITYTKGAALDMETRYRKIFREELPEGLTFRTINSLCFSITRKAMKMGLIPYKSMEDNTNRFLREAYTRITDDFPTESIIKDLQTNISYLKNMLYVPIPDTNEGLIGGKRMRNSLIERPLKINGRSIFSFYRVYEKALHGNGKMDYDDQLVFAHSLLLDNRSLLEEYREMFRYILVDEAQDTSYVQHKVIESLCSGKRGTVFMVGDDDQSIYSFRGAAPEFLLDFKNLYPDGEIKYLENNYRSSSEIIDTANSFIKLNKQRYEKNPIAVRGKNGIGVGVRKVSQEFQYEDIMKTVKAMEGQTAILYRNNENAFPLIVALKEQGISFKTKGINTLFFSHPVVKDVVAFFEYTLNPVVSGPFERISYKTNCYISKKDIRNVVFDFNGDVHDTLWDSLCVHPSVPERTRNACKTLSYEFEQLKKCSAKEAITLIETKIRKNEKTDHCKFSTLKNLAFPGMSLGQYLDRLNWLESTAKNGLGDEESDIILSTVHSSKGLEYDNVIIMDAVNGIWPPYDTTNINEEIRLFYVAMTRAKNRLTVLEYDGLLKSQPFVFAVKAILGLAEGTPTLPQVEKRKSDFSGYSMSKMNKAAQRQYDDELLQRKRYFDRVTNKYNKQAKTETVSAGFDIGNNVIHTSYGSGTVINRDNKNITIKFSENLIKVFDEKICIKAGFLKKE